MKHDTNTQFLFTTSIESDIYNDLLNLWTEASNQAEKNIEINKELIEKHKEKYLKKGIENIPEIKRGRLVTTDPARIFTDYLQQVKLGKKLLSGLKQRQDHSTYPVVLDLLRKSVDEPDVSDLFTIIYKDALIFSGSRFVINPIIVSQQEVGINRNKCIEAIMKIIHSAVSRSIMEFNFTHQPIVPTAPVPEPNEEPAPEESVPETETDPNNEVVDMQYIKDHPEMIQVENESSETEAETEAEVEQKDPIELAKEMYKVHINKIFQK